MKRRQFFGSAAAAIVAGPCLQPEPCDCGDMEPPSMSVQITRASECELCEVIRILQTIIKDHQCNGRCTGGEWTITHIECPD
jgi:hypothetical protein